MKILITNRTMSIRNGAETYVQDLAMELLAQGHRPMVYTAEVGATGRRLIDLTIPVTDDLDTLGVRPDVIHGQHFMTAMTALAYFRDVPMVGVSHGWRPWTETPIRHPNVVRYVAVDEAVETDSRCSTASRMTASRSFTTRSIWSDSNEPLRPESHCAGCCCSPTTC